MRPGRITVNLLYTGYVFDGNDFNNIRWMANDIAVVKVEDDFNFKRRIKGCDFIPRMISYNNQSMDLEKAGITGSIAGWGSRDRYGEVSTTIKTYVFVSLEWSDS